MAVTAQGAALTAQYRRQLQALSAQTLRDLLQLWPVLDKARIDETQRGYLIAVRALVKTQRRAAALLAAKYYENFRAAEGVDSAYKALMFDELSTEILETALRVTGPVAFKRAISNGKALEAASNTALVLQAGAVSRLVLDGGRETTGGNLNRDRKAVGWQRVTDGNPCHFCAMLAGRGAVYRSESSALYGSRGKYHDHCGCTVEAIYDYDAPVRSTNRYYGELWSSVTAGLSGKDAVNAFRKALN